MKKNNTTKTLILEHLKKIPILEVACQKANISRMTLFRWKKEDEQFAKNVEDALSDGILLINDLAENQLVSGIKDKNLSAVQYWLKYHHPNYKNKLEINGKIKADNGQLTPEQEESIKKALELASLLGGGDNLLTNHNLLENKE